MARRQVGIVIARLFVPCRATVRLHRHDKVPRPQMRQGEPAFAERLILFRRAPGSADFILHRRRQFGCE